MPGMIIVRPNMDACKAVSVDTERGNVLIHLPETALKTQIEAVITAVCEKIKNRKGALVPLGNEFQVGATCLLHPNVGMMRSGEGRRRVTIDGREHWLIRADDVLGILTTV